MPRQSFLCLFMAACCFVTTLAKANDVSRPLEFENLKSRDCEFEPLLKPDGRIDLRPKLEVRRGELPILGGCHISGSFRIPKGFGIVTDFQATATIVGTVDEVGDRFAGLLRLKAGPETSRHFDRFERLATASEPGAVTIALKVAFPKLMACGEDQTFQLEIYAMTLINYNIAGTSKIVSSLGALELPFVTLIPVTCPNQ